MIQEYDGLQWEIGEMPVGFSTTDDLFEYMYPAIAKCPECGHKINGTAMMWSRDEDGSGSWLDHVEYTACDCFFQS